MASPSPRKSVLIVEDDLAVRDALAFVLRQEGYEARTAADGAEALDQLHQARPNLILLDLVMPTMDGREFRRKLLEDPQLATIPVVVVSALEGLNDEVAALNVADYLPKTADLDRFLETVRRYCD